MHRGTIALLGLLLVGCGGTEGIRFEARTPEVRAKSEELRDFAREKWHLPLKVRVFYSNQEDGHELSDERERAEAAVALAQLKSLGQALAIAPLDLFSADIEIGPKGREPKATLDVERLHLTIVVGAEVGEEPRVLSRDEVLLAWADGYRWEHGGKWYEGEATVELEKALLRDYDKIARIEADLGLQCTKLELQAGLVRERAERDERHAMFTAGEAAYLRVAQYRLLFSLNRALNTFARWRMASEDETCSVRDEARVVVVYARNVFAAHLGWFLDTVVGGRPTLAVWKKEWWNRNRLYQLLDGEAPLVEVKGDEKGTRALTVPEGSVRAMLSVRLDGDLEGAFEDVDEQHDRWLRNAFAKASTNGHSPQRRRLLDVMRDVATKRIPRAAELRREKESSTFTAWKELWDARIKNAFGYPFYRTIVGLCLLFNQLGSKERPMSAKQLAAFEEHAQPGDIVLVREATALTSQILPGFWPHALLWLGPKESWTSLELGPGQALAQDPIVAQRVKNYRPDEEDHPPRLIEAIAKGVVFNSADHALRKEHFVVLLRPRLSEAEKAQAIRRAIAFEGRPYDFSFDFASDDKLVCTELVYRAYDPKLNFRVALDASKDSPARGIPGVKSVAGRLTMPAQEVARYACYMIDHPDPAPAFRYPGRKLDVVVLFHHERGLLEGEEAVAFLRTTLDK